MTPSMAPRPGRTSIEQRPMVTIRSDGGRHPPRRLRMMTGLVEEMQCFRGPTVPTKRRVALAHPNYHSVLCRWARGSSGRSNPHETNATKVEPKVDRTSLKSQTMQLQGRNGDRLTISPNYATPRPVFLRNDHILGEDMLLISAVEEADDTLRLVLN
jgi:hypothetical protein